MPDILTRIDIDAPVEKVWAILADTAAYDEWNPLITRFRGRLAPGEVIAFMAPFGRRDLPIDARVLEVDEHREIRWRGPKSALVGRLFAGEHYFRLEAREGGGTTFIHGERFSGLVPSLLGQRLETRLLPLYGAMNDALKRRAEAS
jgi:hypothetical protein